MPLQIHSPSGRRPPIVQTLAGDLAVQRGRVHEFCGPSRIALAALVMAKSQGPVLWIYPGWTAERLNPAGLRSFADPARLIFVAAQREEEALWAAEEALRSGVAPLVVAELAHPPALTPVRRLHLAAATGAEAAQRDGSLAPLGLLLVPEKGGAQGVESRWHMAAAPSQTLLHEPADHWMLTRLRARLQPPAQWRLQINQGRETLAVQEMDAGQTAT